ELITVYGDGEQTRDFTFVADVVNAHLLAMDCPTTACAYNICGGSRISINGLLELIGRTTGVSLRLEHETAARGDARHTLGDSSRAKDDFGWSPSVQLEEGIRDEWAWLTSVE
ncbi:MAG TPA: GDP-mannose 4,6-dehydratase, partial [Dehalococcoidia bacterium]